MQGGQKVIITPSSYLVMEQKCIKLCFLVETFIQTLGVSAVKIIGSLDWNVKTTLKSIMYKNFCLMIFMIVFYK